MFFDANTARLSAEAGLALVRSCGYEIPTQLENAAAVVGEFQKILTGPPPSIGPVPTDAKLVAKYLKTAASAAADLEALQKTATDLGGPSVAKFLGEYRDALPGWIAALRADFDKSLGEFTEALAVAPEQLTAISNDRQVAAFAAALRAAEYLEFCLRARVQLGTSVGEAGAAIGVPYVVAALPQPPADPDEFNRAWPELHAAVVAYQNIREGGVPRWRDLLASGLRVNLAPAGGIEQRIGQQQQWQYLYNAINLGGDRRDVGAWQQVG